LSSSSVVGSVVVVEQNISLECVSKILTDILFYVQDIPQSTHTIRGANLIKWCQWEHLLDQILKGFRVRGAGLKLFMVSIDDLVCQLCIGCSLSLVNKGTKLCVITDIFGTSYSFWLVLTYWHTSSLNRSLKIENWARIVCLSLPVPFMTLKVPSRGILVCLLLFPAKPHSVTSFGRRLVDFSQLPELRLWRLCDAPWSLEVCLPDCLPKCLFSSRCDKFSLGAVLTIIIFCVHWSSLE
jgi:hypothetical protein